MIVKTCLLVSDDPDDHIEFSEALSEISEDTVVMTISNPSKAIEVLLLKKCMPEYLVLNLGMSDFSPGGFFDALEGDSLKSVTVIAYGEAMHPSTVRHQRIDKFLDDGLSFSELKKALQAIVRPD